jgi:hypothetical protein
MHHIKGNLRRVFAEGIFPRRQPRVVIAKASRETSLSCRRRQVLYPYIPMKKKIYGQLPLTNMEAAIEKAIPTDRPATMPPYSVIKTEVLRLGLTETDAEAINDVWLSNGFTLKGGRKIKDFKAAIRTWHRNEWFPSQRTAAKNKPVDNKERIRAAAERMQANARNRIR